MKIAWSNRSGARRRINWVWRLYVYDVMLRRFWIWN
jgi:hypothetical protein